MLYDMADLESAAPIVMNLWDKDSGIVSDSYDFLGRCTVFLKDASTNLTMDNLANEKENANSIPKPKWHDIKMGFDESMPACG